MSGENGQPQSTPAGSAPCDSVPLFGKIVTRGAVSAETLWLELIHTLATTRDSDFAPRAYPVIPADPVFEKVVEAEPVVVAPVAAVTEKPVAARPVQTDPAAAFKVGSRPVGSGQVRREVRKVGGQVRSSGSRSRSRSVRTGTWRVRSNGRWISALVSLIIVLVGGGLIVRDVVLRPTPQELAEAETASAEVATRIFAKEEVVKPEPKAAGISKLALVSAGGDWEMATSDWSSAPLAPTDAVIATAPEEGEQTPLVEPILIGDRPSPSEDFIAFAATLKASVVVDGERVRATINGVTYNEGDVLELGAGVRLVGRDANERVLIFEDATRARVKVSY